MERDVRMSIDFLIGDTSRKYKRQYPGPNSMVTGDRKKYVNLSGNERYNYMEKTQPASTPISEHSNIAILGEIQTLRPIVFRFAEVTSTKK